MLKLIMSKKNIKRIELIITILLISIAAIVPFNIAIILFVAIVGVRTLCAWIMCKKCLQEKKDFYWDLAINFILLMGIICLYVRFK